MTSTDVIEIEGLVKTFGRVRALDGLDLQVHAGEAHGFLGPNGAGKSTTIRVLLGLLRPDAGNSRVLGGDPWRDATVLHRRLAYVPGDVALWPRLTGGEVIDLLGRLRGGLDVGRRRELVDRFALDESRRCRTYSKGNRQKVALVAALAADVELLLLDEPTSGLDPLMEAQFRACMQEFRSRGGTVLLSSHVLAEVEHLCDRVTIIRDGRTVESGSIVDLQHLARTSVSVLLDHPAVSFLDLPEVHNLVITGGHLRFDVDTGRLGPVIGQLVPLGIRSLECRPPTLEELFLRHYARGPEGAP
ncbi:MAG TPA: ABC transporter ATP-binding protein [Nocardioides sp.]|uniref:ABC transporter ATP-binding protein n=1 Tax=Nocardioides sp. TaxID=35761 RepID=UPI002C02E9EC|nr:ABC transporter ATP-binding protein [Nocardioides sp.]HTW13891.1 ABC transporter ATP-binding protein [Nocardioides sp.]